MSSQPEVDPLCRFLRPRDRVKEVRSGARGKVASRPTSVLSRQEWEASLPAHLRKQLVLRDPLAVDSRGRSDTEARLSRREWGMTMAEIRRERGLFRRIR